MMIACEKDLFVQSKICRERKLPLGFSKIAIMVFGDNLIGSQRTLPKSQIIFMMN